MSNNGDVSGLPTLTGHAADPSDIRLQNVDSLALDQLAEAVAVGVGANEFDPVFPLAYRVYSCSAVVSMMPLPARAFFTSS